MDEAKVWVEKVIIPTYEIGEAEKNPVFLEKRVYQGSSGKVYPYPVVEKISNEKRDKEYTAVFLENEYVKVMVLPELGGRIQRAYDKTNGYDFVYYNQVIKPALVGLTGPWISGGIEFNWPQHHRPTTFLPVDFETAEGEDGSRSVLCHDVDQMYGTECVAKITLYPGRAYIEITGQLYNRTSLPQTFLWWANPAVAVNDNTQSIFPPDVHAVMDHGKRDVSRFPIATGVYYKKDYSDGVDISRYKNIPVPTSYMAEKSKYDFVGGYDYGKEAGLLHVADHHISPGKKQWTWGCGDFGRAWDRNLTEEDGPYVELMTGVYTDNQPDFTWLKPFEEKSFQQYFMPYKGVGQVKNAAKEAAVHLSCSGDAAEIIVYASARYENAKVLLLAAGDKVLEETITLSPNDVYRKTVDVTGKKEEELQLKVLAEGRCLVEYRPEIYGIPKLPEPAKAAGEPEEIRTCEELYLTGQHIEQYRHATYLPDPYYLEGLKRDPGDIRLNNAYGQLLLRRGRFGEAEGYFRKALERLTERNPNPYNSESYYLLGLALLYQGMSAAAGGGSVKKDDAAGADAGAYDAFYKAAWSNEQQEMSYYYLAALDAKAKEFERAYAHVERALIKNSHNVKARGLKAYLLRKLGRTAEAAEWVKENLALDPFDFISGNERVLLCRNERDEFYGGKGERARCRELSEGGDKELRREWNRKMRGFHENYLMAARDYGEMGAYEEAVGVLEECGREYPMLYYYRAYYTAVMEKQKSAGGPPEKEDGLSEEVKNLLRKAEACSWEYCFPNKLEDIAVLWFAVENGCEAKAGYYLGCLFYDKLQWKEALRLWEASAQADPAFPAVHRNLSLAYYNRRKEIAKEARTGNSFYRNILAEAGQGALQREQSKPPVSVGGSICEAVRKGLGQEAREPAAAEWERRCKIRAKEAMEKAFALNEEDERIFLELDQLYKKLGRSFERRLEQYEAHRELIERRDDLYIEYITLVNLTGAHEKAYEYIMGSQFHPWEGGEGKITTQYTLALLETARKALGRGHAAEAEEMLRKALVYPENLGEGKLEGTKDNHIYYYLGLALEAQGRQEAEECFRKAVTGTDEPAGAMYYNDQPADMILYQGLAYEKLGRTREAKARFYRLIDYGERHLDDEVKVEYFAVSLPDFLIFDEDYTRKNRAHCYYLMGLGHMGLRDKAKAAEYFKEAAAIEPSHMMCRIYMSRIADF